MVEPGRYNLLCDLMSYVIVGNKIGADGARAIAETLHTNALTSLNLDGMLCYAIM